MLNRGWDNKSKRNSRCKSMWLTESDAEQIAYLCKAWKLDNETAVIRRSINQSVAIEKSFCLSDDKK